MHQILRTVTALTVGIAVASLLLALTPPAGAYTVVDGTARIQNVHINGGDSERNVLPGTPLTIQLHLRLTDPGCTSCREQVEVGFANQAPDQCIFDGIPGPTGVSQTVTFTETAASVTGSYFLAFDRAYDSRCLATGPLWWNGRPDPDTQYLGRVQVKPNVLIDGQVRLSTIQLNSGPDRELTVHVGSQFQVQVTYQVRDTACPTCREQLEVGFANAAPDQCFYDGVPGATITTGTVAFSETAPTAPGSYFLAIDRAQDSRCLASGATWWNDTPDPQTQYLAHIQVTP